jgi:hypothetical protein
MELNLFFNCFIIILIGVLIFFNIKTYIDTIQSTKKSKQSYSKLVSDFMSEEKKHEINSRSLILLDELHNNLFERLFKITRDILLMQKIIMTPNKQI